MSLAKRDLAEMAKEYAAEALQTLAQIMREGDADQARISAANAILDRAYGRPIQGTQIGQDPDNPLPMAIAVTFIGPNG